MRKIDIEGVRFGKLVAIRESGKSKSGVVWSCACDCGRVVDVVCTSLRTGNTKSCGCAKKEKLVIRNSSHGRSRDPEYVIWAGLRDRCCNKNNKSYHRYGGRGIYVCKEWGSFDKFFSDMGPRPSKSHQIDRINNNDGYYKENCRWTDKLTQANNTRTNVHVVAFGEEKTIAEWCRDGRCKVKSQTLSKRLINGWDAELAISTDSRVAHSKAMLGIDPNGGDE